MRRLKFLLSLGAFALLLSPSSGAPDPLEWPSGDGQKLVKANCLICHSGEIVMGQRLSAENWAKVVEKMAGWGSPIPEKDRAALVEYLSKNFNPETPEPKPIRMSPQD